MAVKNEVAEEMLPGGKGTARASVPQRGLRSKLLPGSRQYGEHEALVRRATTLSR